MSAAKGWERGECRIVTTEAPTAGEPARAWFSAEAPGLAVTQAPWDELIGVWAVTHASSGRCVAGGLDTLAEARKVALRIAPLTDWTRSRNELFSTPGLGKKVRQAVVDVCA